MTEYIEEGRVVSARPTSYEKQIFLIGDSIRIGYCRQVAKALSDIADVRYPDENCRNTQYTYINLSWWKNIFSDPSKVELVYFNNGHWDIAHWDSDEESLNSAEDYCKMLLRIVARLKKLFPRAKIVFATTTPANPNGKMGVNPRSNAEIKAYNERAVSCLEKSGVIIHDLYKILEDKDESFYSDYCHLTPEGFDFLAERVSEFIRSNI